MKSAVFETNYENYCRQIAGLDFSALKETLGIELQDQKILVPFLGETFTVSRQGISDETGRRPHYRDCVILSKYLLLCPDLDPAENNWVGFRDFKDSAFFMANFQVTVEERLARHFTGKTEALRKAAASAAWSAFSPRADISSAGSWSVRARTSTSLST